MIAESILALAGVILGVVAGLFFGRRGVRKETLKEVEHDFEESDRAEADAIRKRVADTECVRDDDIRYRD